MRLKAVTMFASFALAAPVLAHPHEDQTEVLVIVAHPDDELFIAPAIAAEVRSGSRVTIVYATDGDAGPGVSDFAPGEQLAAARRLEAQCAAEALGAGVAYLQLGDGTLTATPRRGDSPAVQLRAKLRDEIAQRRPEIVITWGPDGGYGHGDHRMVSAITTEIVQSMDADARPALLYSAIPSGRMPPNTPFGSWGETDPEFLTVSFAYNDEDLARANQAAGCHVTQFDAPTRAALMPFLDSAVWQGEVWFREAF